MRAKKCVTKTNHPTTSTQSSFEASLFSASPYPSTSQRHSEITNAVAFHLAKDMCQINTMINEGFKFLVNTLDKRYVIPSHNYFSKVALPPWTTMYSKRRREIESDLANVKYIATTTDLWSSRTMEPYMSLTVHYIYEDFAMQS